MKFTRRLLLSSSRVFSSCSYTKWIHQIKQIKTSIPLNPEIGPRVDDEPMITQELYEWTDRYGLTSRKLKKAKVPQMVIKTAPYLNCSQMIDYAKILSFLYLVDDLYFDNAEDCTVQQNELCSVYADVLSLPTVIEECDIIKEFEIFLYFQMREKEMNTNQAQKMLHYEDYCVLNRRYSSGFMLLFLYLCRLEASMDSAVCNQHFMYHQLVELAADIIILMNDLLGFDREQQNGEICTFPLLVKHYENCSDEYAQQKTFDLIVRKIRQYESLLVMFRGLFPNQSTNHLSLWIIGYIQHEINCDRQKANEYILSE